MAVICASCILSINPAASPAPICIYAAPGDIDIQDIAEIARWACRPKIADQQPHKTLWIACICGLMETKSFMRLRHPQMGRNRPLLGGARLPYCLGRVKIAHANPLQVMQHHSFPPLRTFQPVRATILFCLMDGWGSRSFNDIYGYPMASPENKNTII